MSYKVNSVAVIKQGSGSKGPWTLREVTLEGSDKKARGFDAVIVGDEVELTETQNGDYVNVNYKKASSSPKSSTTVTGGAADVALARKTLAILVLLAEQMGVDKERLLEVMES